MVPLVPILAILFSTALIIGLSPMTQLRLIVWLIIGLAIYFGYGRKHSKVQQSLANNTPTPARQMAD
jgi:basic amino acid/polyamine antiporter, APA family